MAVESSKHYKRTKFLVASKFQLQYVGLILGLMFLTAFLCSYISYYTSLLYLGEKLANVYPQGRLAAIIQNVNMRMLISVLLFSPLVAILALFLSHRIAGPMYRMEKTLFNIAEGDLTPRSHLALRKNDEFVPIANGINKVTMTFKATVALENAAIAKLSSDVENLKRLVSSQADGHPAINDCISDIDSNLKSLSREIGKYRLT